MDLSSIRDALRKRPFTPFELCLADGRRVPIEHPEFVAMNNRVVIVFDDESSTTTIEPLLIVSLEPHRESKKRSNGSSKNRGK